MEQSRISTLDKYLELAFRAQELDYYYEMGTGSYADFDKAREQAYEFWHEHGITRQELTDYKKRNSVSVNGVAEAVAKLEQFFKPVKSQD